MGRVVKPHGLDGEVVVDLWTDRTERLAPGSRLTTDHGDLVVVASRPFQGRFLVRFEGTSSREGAESLRAAVLRAAPLVAEGELWVHELVGARMTSTDGTPLGTVVAVEANPASDLLVLDGGGLVPMRFVVSHRPGVEVTVDIPDGLLD